MKFLLSKIKINRKDRIEFFSHAKITQTPKFARKASIVFKFKYNQPKSIDPINQ